MTDVGPPDCATKRFPTSSSIIFLLLPRRAEANQLSMFGSPSKSERNHANEPRACQRGNHTESACPNIAATRAGCPNGIDRSAQNPTMGSRPETSYEL